MTTHPLTQAIESIEKRVESFNAERKQLAAELESVIASAQTLLSELDTAGASPRRGRPAGKRGPGRPKGAGARKRKPMSAEARAKIAAAQKARWAKQKAGEKKK